MKTMSDLDLEKSILLAITQEAYESDEGRSSRIIMLREQREGFSVIVTVNAHIVTSELAQLLILNEAVRVLKSDSEETQTPKTTN
jgi:hypothetical protein